MNVSNLAFYIGKSANQNVLIYSFNILESGNIDVFRPLDLYWIMREKSGNPTESLTAFEDKYFNYDIDIDPSSSDIIVKIRAFPAQPIIIRKTEDKHHAFIKQNGKDVYLKKLFIHTSGMMNLTVDQLDIIYQTTESKKLFTEKIKRPDGGWENESVDSGSL